MSNFKPNHICKNRNCKKGVDGGRKHYYACDYCTRTKSWKSVACSYECYEEYVNQVIEARSKDNNVSITPERTDLTENEVNELMEKPVEEVLEKSKKDLIEYADFDGNVDFEKTIDAINEEIDKENEESLSDKKTTKKRSKK